MASVGYGNGPADETVFATPAYELGTTASTTTANNEAFFFGAFHTGTPCGRIEMNERHKDIPEPKVPVSHWG